MVTKNLKLKEGRKKKVLGVFGAIHVLFVELIIC